MTDRSQETGIKTLEERGREPSLIKRINEERNPKLNFLPQNIDQARGYIKSGNYQEAINMAEGVLDVLKRIEDEKEKLKTSPEAAQSNVVVRTERDAQETPEVAADRALIARQAQEIIDTARKSLASDGTIKQ